MALGFGGKVSKARISRKNNTIAARAKKTRLTVLVSRTARQGYKCDFAWALVSSLKIRLKLGERSFLVAAAKHHNVRPSSAE